MTQSVLRRRAALAALLALGATPAFAQNRERPPQGPGPGREPPFDKIAQDLGIPADRVRAAFEKVGPPPRGQNGPPSEQQLAQHAQKLASAMDVPVETLKPVLEKYRPAPPPRH